jgi:hypothetical protein
MPAVADALITVAVVSVFVEDTAAVTGAAVNTVARAAGKLSTLAYNLTVALLDTIAKLIILPATYSPGATVDEAKVMGLIF